MRRFTILFAVLLAAAAMPLLAQTNYHYNENMNCSDCHSMHASAHNNLTDGLAITTPNPGASPNRTRTRCGAYVGSLRAWGARLRHPPKRARCSS